MWCLCRVCLVFWGAWLAGGGGLQRGLVALGRRGGADERGEAGHAPGEASGGGGAGRPRETKGNPPSGAMWRPFFLFSFFLGERSPPFKLNQPKKDAPFLSFLRGQWASEPLPGWEVGTYVEKQEKNGLKQESLESQSTIHDWFLKLRFPSQTTTYGWFLKLPFPSSRFIGNYCLGNCLLLHNGCFSF